MTSDKFFTTTSIAHIHAFSESSQLAIRTHILSGVNKNRNKYKNNNKNKCRGCPQHIAVIALKKDISQSTSATSKIEIGIEFEIAVVIFNNSSQPPSGHDRSLCCCIKCKC